MDINNKIISHLLSDLRYKKGMTQGDLASKIGITQANLSQIENGKRQPSKDVLIKIREIFGDKICLSMSEASKVDSVFVRIYKLSVDDIMKLSDFIDFLEWKKRTE